jgi:hypothetical protein
VVEVRAEYGEECRRPGQYYPCVDIRSGGLGPEQAVSAKEHDGIAGARERRHLSSS